MNSDVWVCLGATEYVHNKQWHMWITSKKTDRYFYLFLDPSIFYKTKKFADKIFDFFSILSGKFFNLDFKANNSNNINVFEMSDFPFIQRKMHSFFSRKYSTVSRKKYI